MPTGKHPPPPLIHGPTFVGACKSHAAVRTHTLAHPLLDSEGGGAVVSQITPRPRDSGMSSDLKTFAKSFLNENRSSVASFAGGESSSTADQPRLTTARVSLLG